MDPFPLATLLALWLLATPAEEPFPALELESLEGESREAAPVRLRLELRAWRFGVMERWMPAPLRVGEVAPGATLAERWLIGAGVILRRSRDAPEGADGAAGVAERWG